MSELAEQLNHEVLRRLNILRLEKGLTHQQLAEMTGLDRSYIGLLESGKRRPTLEVTVKLCLAMDTSLSRVLSGIEKEVGVTEESLQDERFRDGWQSCAIKLGKAIRQGRKKVGLSQTELTKRTGIPSTLISQIERGKVYPTLVDLKAISEGMDTKLSSLISVLD